jgi:hypothetical protein
MEFYTMANSVIGYAKLGSFDQAKNKLDECKRCWFYNNTFYCKTFYRILFEYAIILDNLDFYVHIVNNSIDSSFDRYKLLGYTIVHCKNNILKYEIENNRKNILHTFYNIYFMYNEPARLNFIKLYLDHLIQKNKQVYIINQFLLKYLVYNPKFKYIHRITTNFT